MGLGFSNSNFQLLADAPEQQITNSSYTNYSTNLTAPPNTANAAIWVYTDGQVLIDDCSISVEKADPPPSGDSLVLNGNFESNLTNWFPCSGSGFGINFSAGINDSKSLQLTDGGCIYQQVSADAGQNFTLTCQAKRNSPTWTTMTLSFSDSNYTTLSSEQTVIDSTNFQNFSASQTAPSSTSNAVVTFYSESVAQFDDCVLVADGGETPPPPPPPPPPPSSDNLLSNGGFESGRAGWIDCSATGLSIDGDAATGTSALRVANGCIYQQVDAGSLWTSMTLSYLDANFQLLQNDLDAIDTVNYSNYSVNLTAPSGTRYAVATLYSESTAHFDTCILSGGDEPPPPPPPPPSDGNLLENGSFTGSDGSQPAGWSIGCTNSASLSNNEFNISDGTCVDQNLSSDTIDVLRNNTFKLQCFGTNASGYAGLAIRFANTGITFEQSIPVGEYGVIEVIGTTPSNATTGVVNIYAEGALVIDNCSLTIIDGEPPPSSSQDSVLVPSSGNGQWGSVQAWPANATHMANLTDGRVIAWSAPDNNTDTPGYFANNTGATIFDPVTETFQSSTNPTHDMYCAGVVTMSDGSLIAAGGGGDTPSRSKVSKFDGTTWTRIADMPNPHWYGTAVVDAFDNVLITHGDGPDFDTPSYQTDFLSNSSEWRNLPGVTLAGTDEPGLTFPHWYPAVHLSPRGTIFHSGTTTEMHEITTDGIGTSVSRGSRNQDGITGETYREWASAIMMDDNKILMTGGRLNNTASTNTSVIIDISESNPVISRTAPMNYTRAFHSPILLPNGEVLVLGGNSTGQTFDDTQSRLVPEIYNIETNTWRDVSAMAIPRNYHSTATLLQDGRVLTAGGGACDCAANHQDGQIYSPPYLFNSDGSAAARPAISLAPSNIGYGQSFNVNILGSGANDIERFSMIRFSAVTHSTNSDLRQDALRFTNLGNGSYELQSNSNRNVVTPGYYYLFATNAQGVPSVARIIQIN